MKSIRARLIVLFIFVTTTTLGGFAVYEQMLLSQELEGRFKELQEDVVARLQKSLSEPLWALDQGVINAKLEAALIPLDVHAVYLVAPDMKGIIGGVARNSAGLARPSLSMKEAQGVLAMANIFPPSGVDAERRKISIGRVYVYFSHDRIDETLRVAYIRRSMEVLAMDLLLLVMLTLSLRMVFIPLRGLRDALFSLASNEGEELEELPKTNRIEFDEVIDGFNLTLRNLKRIILRSSQAENAAREATRATNEALAQVKAAQEELIGKNKQLELLTVTDRLTLLNNRFKLDQVLEDELNRSRRYSSDFSLLLLDVDHFKLVNDTYGHQVGDRVLIELARLLTNVTRNVDIVGRWGGEEFLVICPDTKIEGALDLAEKLRQAISEHAFPVAGNLTASLGVTSFKPGDSIHLMMARADDALYLSKKMGRNRVEASA